MRVIVTGGTGLIGRALVAELAASGHQVVVLSRGPAGHPGLPAGARAERWDGRTAEGWGALADGAGAIVNLAGENIAAGRWTPERKRSILESRIQAGEAVVQAVKAAERRPRVVVQASAVGYYGPSGDQEITEEAPPGDGFLARVCVDWEASTFPVEGLGVRRPVIRTGTVLSAGGGALPRLVQPFLLFVGGRLGSGHQRFPWIHIADQVAAIRFLIEKEDATGPFNLCVPESPTNREFSRALARVLRRPAVVPVSSLALKLAFGEMASVLLTGQRAAPRRLLEMGFRFRFPLVDEALRDLLQLKPR